MKRDLDDATLVRSTLDGRPEAFGVLYDRYATLIRAVCYDTTRDLGQAEDLAQETFFRAHRKLSELREADRFGAWLVGVARFICKEWYRSSQRDRLEFGAPILESATGGDATRQIDDALAIREILATLPDQERLAIDAFYFSGCDHTETARLLGLSKSGFYKLLDRARRRIARRAATLGEPSS